MSFPSKMIFPEVGSWILRIVLPMEDFPQPDSPTIPNVSPRSRTKETFSTACTFFPCAASKYFVKPCISNMGFVIFMTVYLQFAVE